MTDSDLHILPLVLPSGEAISLAYRTWGTPNPARAVLAVHGLTRNGADFARIGAALAECGWWVIAPDMPGRGASSYLAHATDYSYPTYLFCLEQLRQSLRIERMVWLGTSMGGILGMMVAAGMPDRVQALVLNDIGARIPAEGMRRIAAYASRPQHFATRAEGEAYLRATFSSFGLQTPDEWQEFAAASLVPAQSGYTLAYDTALTQPLAAYLDADAHMTDIDLSAFWAAVQCPTLLLRGADSDILPASVAAEMAQAPHTTRIEFPACGHAPALLSAAHITPVVEWLQSVMDA